MAERLGLQDRSQSFVLNYLDLWQELRSNFVVCCRRSDAPPRVVLPATPHPTFVGDGHGLRHQLRLQRLRLLGGRLPSRTADGEVVLRAHGARALRARGLDAALVNQLGAAGLVLGERDHGPRLPAHSDFERENEFLTHTQALRIGKRAPNPLYHHLFAAFELAQRHPELQLPDLDAQLGRWLPWSDPLEARPIQFGLTPYATAQRLATNVHEHLQREPLPVAGSYQEVRLRNDAAALQQVRTFLAASSGLPKAPLADEALRELFVLLFGHDALFVTFEQP